jgi:penicillin-binding protein 3
MKKKGIMLIVIIAIIIGTGIVFFMRPSPEESFKDYINSWENQEFLSMYKSLSEDSKNLISEEEFVKRYQSIYEGIEASKLSINIDENEKISKSKDGKVEIPYTLSMNTVAGPVQYNHRSVLTKDGFKWLVDWNTEMIFPGLEEGEKIGVQFLAAKRGQILDRNGYRLAGNGTAFEIGIVPEKLGDNSENSKKQIQDITGITIEQINKSLSQTWVKPDMFVPIIKISEEEKGKVDKLIQIPGVSKRNIDTRVYYYKESASHLVGYVGTISKEEIEKYKDEGYGKTDKIGKTGLEQTFEKRLKGQNGWEIFIKDINGEKTKTIVKKEAKDGEDIKLTIDAELQKSLYERLNGDSGSAVAIHPKTGEILSLTSSPSYDPNKLVLGIQDKDWAQIRDNPQKPLLNRFSQTFAPGSTFKPVVAGIGLKTGAISAGSTTKISGLKWQKDASWGRYYVTRVKDPGRPVNLRDALVFSDNIYFADAALKIGQEKLSAEAKNLGFGEEFALPSYIKPSQLAGNNGFKDKTGIQLADSGYGQGQVMTSPLHIAAMYTTFVNQGNMIKPFIEVKEDKKDNNIWHADVFSPEDANTVLKDLIQVVEDPKGSGHSAKIKGETIAGKTGTAEIKQSKEDIKGTENGWFAAFNVDNPRILVVMMVEDVKSRGGSHYVVPKVGKVIEEYIKK